MPGHVLLRRLRAKSARKADEGFTIIELTVAMGLAAFVFAAVAAVVLGGLRSLAVSKARTQGNEVATQAIEDLQRFGYAELGHCTTPAGAPSGLTDSVILQGGCAGAPVEDSCTNQSGTAISSNYACVRNNISYTVKRYIAWSNPEQTSKRLAVFVTWTDEVGLHTVSQQSSVRAPGVANIVGLKPPTLANPSVGSTSVSAPAGKIAQSILVGVDATGLTADDQVAVVFSALDVYGNPLTESKFLTPTNQGANWTGVIEPGDDFTFGAGTQFFRFSALRAKDGKQTAAIATQIVTFTTCTSACPAVSPPTLTSPSTPGTVSLYPSGAIKASFTAAVTSANLTTDDQVTVNFMTQDGMRSLALQIDSTQPCTVISCRWTTTVTTTNGYAFASGSQSFYFTAQQVKSPDPTSVDQGSTVAITSSTPVVFGS